MRSRVMPSKKVTPHGGPVKHGDAGHGDQSGHKFDLHFEDQAYNVQADISMLLDEHFEAVREKFNGILRRNTDNLNRWITTDLRYIDTESKTAAQVTSSAVGRLTAAVKSGKERT